MSKRPPRNLFYGLVVAAGMFFSLTACAYGVLLVRGLRGVDNPGERGALLEFLDRQGMWLFGGELLVLGLAAWAAIALDCRRERRARLASAAYTAPPATPDDPRA